MSFGALFLGNSGQVIVDQDHPVYHFVYNGTYSLADNGTTSVAFPAPILSPEPPLVLVAPDGAHAIFDFKLTGGANNWTGFTCRIFADPGFSGIIRSGLWRVAAVYLPASSSWGLKVLDASAKVVFDSNKPMVKFISGVQVWNKVGRNPSWQGNWTTDTWGAPYVQNTYFMLNPWGGGYSDGGQMGIGFINGGRGNATQINSFMMRVGVGRPDVTFFNWPLILAI